MTLSRGEIEQLRKDVETTSLDHLCDISRTTGQKDRYGHTIPTFAALATNVKCHFWFKTERELVGQEINAVIADASMYVPVTTDVTEQDQITNVRNQLGEVLIAKARITSVLRRVSHLLIQLKVDDA